MRDSKTATVVRGSRSEAHILQRHPGFDRIRLCIDYRNPRLCLVRREYPSVVNRSRDALHSFGDRSYGENLFVLQIGDCAHGSGQ
jgi:hypothetical protein